jgi:hypothetical protein
MTIHCERIETQKPDERCTACTPPDDREPMMRIDFAGVGGAASMRLCEYHRAGLVMMVGMFAADALNEPDDDESEPAALASQGLRADQSEKP